MSCASMQTDQFGSVHLGGVSVVRLSEVCLSVSMYSRELKMQGTRSTLQRGKEQAVLTIATIPLRSAVMLSQLWLHPLKLVIISRIVGVAMDRLFITTVSAVVVFCSFVSAGVVLIQAAKTGENLKNLVPGGILI